ncbi:MAG TPA: nucleotidyltransferase family protein [Terriglobales bacterium]|jgi:D-glycero-alpha-D-manno-heptose 1-phosphate guanylyltransferase|nr:nucleotidyltransferase family protein [Terriglobales bacterium]
MHDVKAVVLAGGLGTRLRSVVPSKPKVLASIGERSFLELLIRQLRSQGIRRLVMCTGYLAEQIESQFGDGGAWEVSIEYSREEKPLGTAGAVKLAQRHLRDSPDFFVLNGDSFLEVDFGNLLAFHRGHAGALASMAVLRVENASRYGTVRVDSNNRVSGFMEKTGCESPGLVNGGVYVFDQAVSRRIPEGPVSLERDVFPRLLDDGVYAQEQHGMFIDIGTPADYERAQELLRFC